MPWWKIRGRNSEIGLINNKPEALRFLEELLDKKDPIILIEYFGEQLPSIMHLGMISLNKNDFLKGPTEEDVDE